MNVDPPKLESAEERAQRIWRNNQITRQIQSEHQVTGQRSDYVIINDIGQPDWTKISQHVEVKPQISRFRKIMTELFKNKNNDTINNYRAMIRHRKRILMLEKIRRLENGREE